MFIFDGGIVAETDLVLDEKDHDSYVFVSKDDLASFLSEPILGRVKLALDGKESKAALYSENQKV